MRIYNTLTRSKEEFAPREPGKVSMYVCGPTVYNLIHIGNARTFLSFDTVRRYLEWKGYEVSFVQNVTDVDDKIINRAHEEGRTAAEVATEYTNAFIEDMRAMGVADPTYRPLATETIPEMIDMIERLIAKGHAYEVDGDVYFAVRSYAGYGKLSGRDVDDMRSGARIEVDTRKADPLDFAVWKSAKPGEPSWPSPWGLGRPGWHIECSAMSERELGLPFDIHGGGADLIFPHHENEIAQSEAATGLEFARFWVHGGMLQINSEKMSKSLGNFLLLREVRARYAAPVIRLLMLQTHYRSPLDFSDSRLDEAATALDRIESFARNASWFAASRPAASVDPAVDRGEQGLDENEDSTGLLAMMSRAREKFAAEMDDDFNTAGALAAVFELMRDVNTLMGASEEFTAADREAVGTAGALVTELVGVLGVALVDAGDGVEYPEGVLAVAGDIAGYSGEDRGAAIEALLERRATARAGRDWATADAVRDRLAQLGISIEDTPQGARVVLS